MEEFMSQSTAARAEPRGDAQKSDRPVASFRQGGVEVNVWKNETANGEMFNTTITNSYRDHKTGEWRETGSYSPEELAILVQLSTQAFQEIVRQKTRPASLK
jgi:hypothetical protein